MSLCRCRRLLGRLEIPCLNKFAFCSSSVGTSCHQLSCCHSSSSWKWFKLTSSQGLLKQRTRLWISRQLVGLRAVEVVSDVEGLLNKAIQHEPFFIKTSFLLRSNFNSLLLSLILIQNLTATFEVDLINPWSRIFDVRWKLEINEICVYEGLRVDY